MTQKPTPTGNCQNLFARRPWWRKCSLMWVGNFTFMCTLQQQYCRELLNCDRTMLSVLCAFLHSTANAASRVEDPTGELHAPVLAKRNVTAAQCSSTSPPPPPPTNALPPRRNTAPPTSLECFNYFALWSYSLHSEVPEMPQILRFVFFGLS